MSTVALTGATGFLGRAIAEVLSAQGHTVRALARDPARLPALAGLQPIRGDLRDRDACAALLDAVDSVVHCAGLVKARSRSEFFAVNAEAARTLAESALRAGVRRFVLISSLAAREPALSDYSASKAAGEEAVRAAPGLDWTVLRPPGIYGPNDEATAPLLKLARLGLLPVLGPADARMSLIYVRDCAEAVAACLASPDTVGRVYELDDGAGGHAWRDLGEAFTVALGRPVRLLTIPPFFLHGATGLGALLAGLTGRASFLTAGKVRELRHRDWVSRVGDLQQDANWRPKVKLSSGLQEACFLSHRVT